MSNEPNPEIYLRSKDLLISLTQGDTTGRTIYELPSWFEWIAAFQCNQCKRISILNGEMERFDRKSREMGFETFYGSTEIFSCPNCDADITVESFVTYYAMSWFCDFECDDAEVVQIDYLWHHLKKLHEAGLELRRLKSEKEDFEFRLELLAKQAQKTNGYVLIVEGDDEEEIWSRLLMRKCVDMTKINIAKYGDGGFDAAIRGAKYFKGKILKSIPHKLIVDSDNKPEEKRIKLRKNGIRNFHILDRKEIESYLLEPKAISQILNISQTIVEQELHEIGKQGKEELDYLFRKFTGKKANPSAKGLIAGALEKVPHEISKIIDEIEATIARLESITQEREEYGY